LRLATTVGLKLLGLASILVLSLLSSTDGVHASSARLLPEEAVQITQVPLAPEDASAAPSEAPAPQWWPPSPNFLIELAQVTWPEDQPTAVRILDCESKAGTHEDTYLLEANNGGPMQINRETWRPFFEANYG
jgi:hypothetical protein